MDETVVPVEKLELREDPEALSPPWIDDPVHKCATAVTVRGFLPHAEVDLEIDGAVQTVQAEFPEPDGVLVPTSVLGEGQVLRARQRVNGVQSAWSAPVTTRSHLRDFPAGPPRPRINPAPPFTCGSRSGVDNLLGGANVWITADGVEVGRVDGCGPLQGVDVNPFYGTGQRVRAHTELCGDEAPASVEHVVGPAPLPLAVPQLDPTYSGSEQVRITGIANGARVTVTRGASSLGTFRCWGGSLLVPLAGGATAGEVVTASQQLCASDPPSGPGTTTTLPCSALPAPAIGPLQAGDTAVRITSSVPGARIAVYRNAVQVGLGSAPRVTLSSAVVSGDLVHVVQSLEGCSGQLATQATVACIDPPVLADPSDLDLFPVGQAEYVDGPVRGNIFYPAVDEGFETAFAPRLDSAPVVVMAHGNHSPADPSYLGYEYFQRSLAAMGIAAVSVDCNALNGGPSGVGNIEDRADLIIDNIRFLQGLGGAAPFGNRLDWGRLGLMGHSRGGDAVVTAAPAVPDARVLAVLALAPTNFRYWAGLPTIEPKGYAFQTILPAADGDVVDNNGAQFYDRATPGPLASQVYVHSTNHNFFNRQWLFDDGATPVVSRLEHERVLDAYGCAFFRAFLLGHSTDAFLTGRARPAGTPSQLVDLAFRVEGAVTVDDHEDGNTIAANSLGLPTTAFAAGVDEFPFDQVAGAYNGAFYGLTTGMVIRPEKSDAEFRTEVGSEDLRRGRQVWVRVAEVVEGRIPAGGTDFHLGLEDGGGNVGWVAASAVGGVPRPFDRPGSVKSMLSTLRFDPRCARPVDGRLDLSRIVAIWFRLSDPAPRTLAFDDLQFVAS